MSKLFKKCAVLTLVPISFLFLWSCSSTEQLTLQEVEGPIEVDGSLSSWNTDTFRLNTSDEIQYHATLYEDFLYVFVDVRNPIADRAIRQMGLIVYLSNSRDDRNKVGIGYPAGSFNLLREYPNAYNEFITDEEWGQKPENIELMNDLSEDLFSKVMIVERYDDRPEHGFVDKSQLEIDGMEIATDEDRRYVSLEMKIPIDGSSIYNVTKNDLWIGFAVEPPSFRIRHDSNSNLSRQDRRYGQTRGMPRQTRQRQLYSKNDWFKLSVN